MAGLIDDDELQCWWTSSRGGSRTVSKSHPGARQNGAAVDVRAARAEDGSPAAVAQARRQNPSATARADACFAPAMRIPACIRVTNDCAKRRACVSSSAAPLHPAKRSNAASNWRGAAGAGQSSRTAARVAEDFQRRAGRPGT